MENETIDKLRLESLILASRQKIETATGDWVPLNSYQMIIEAEKIYRWLTATPNDTFYNTGELKNKSS